ncbi:MAG: MFS transporter [SAR324 cluster bacterium]|nr:MFS transporter [SAR324 cluster bacterium]
MLRNPALLTLWGGEFASRIGESIFQIALLWYLLELTESSLHTGVVTMISYLPAFVVGVWAGVVVDRLDYRRVLLAANLCRIALAAGIPLLFLAGALPVAGIAAMGFLISGATAFFNPARDAIIPLLARRSELLGANSLVQSAWQFSLVIGPLLAAAGAEFLPTVHLFFGVSLAFALSLLVLLRLGLRGLLAPPDGAPAESALATAPPGGFFAEFRGGLGYLWSERRVFWIWIITLLNNFFLMGPVFVGMPVYVRSYLGGTFRDYGLIEATYAGGMIVATWLIGRFGARFNPLHVLFLALIYDGLTYVPLLWVTTVKGTLLIILIHSLGIPAITISRITALHRIVPQALQGRVFSYFHLAVAGMTALSIGVVGVVLTRLPANQLFAAIGVLSASCGVLGLLLPVFRKG